MKKKYRNLFVVVLLVQIVLFTGIERIQAVDGWRNWTRTIPFKSKQWEIGGGPNGLWLEHGRVSEGNQYARGRTRYGDVSPGAEIQKVRLQIRSGSFIWSSHALVKLRYKFTFYVNGTSFTWGPYTIWSGDKSGIFTVEKWTTWNNPYYISGSGEVSISITSIGQYRYWYIFFWVYYEKSVTSSFYLDDTRMY